MVFKVILSFSVFLCSAAFGEELICMTEDCKELGKRIKNSIDDSVEPCDDFYKFACGKYVKSAEMRADQGFVNGFEEMQDKLQSQLKTILEEEIKETEPMIYRNVRHFYKLCMDEKKMNARGVEPMKKLINEAGGWPVLGKWEKDKWSILELEVKLKNLGLDTGSLFELSVVVDLKENNRHVIQLDHPELELSREYYVEGESNKNVQAQFKYMVDVAVAMGAEKSAAETQMKEVIQFVIEMAKITEYRGEALDYQKMYKDFKLSDLEKEVDWLDWKTLVKKIFPESVKVQDDEKIVVFDLIYLKSLKDLIKKYDSKKEVIANFMIWYAISGYTDELTNELRQRYFESQKQITGIKERSPRWKECFEDVYNRLPLALSSLYVKEYFDGDAKVAVTDITRRLRLLVITDLESFNWLPTDTRMTAIGKAVLMIDNIGYPDELLDLNILTEYYKNLKLNQDNYLEALLDWAKWDDDVQYGRLREPYDQRDWRYHGSVAEANGYFDITENSMDFPAGLLQMPFFSNQVPSYVNYAAIGQFTGQEFTHAFFDEGSQFDQVGNLNNWWDAESKKKFGEKEECFQKQYNSFECSQTHLKINGTRTLSMNIGDNGGLKLAYRAYKQDRSLRRGEDATLPDLPYTPEKLFWITAANIWCTRITDETLSDWIETDNHAPPEFRVNGVLMNTPEFSETFGCAKGKKMNPENKCTVW